MAVHRPTAALLRMRGVPKIGYQVQVVHWCKEKGIGLVVVGPEAPLVAGLVDSLKQSGIRCTTALVSFCLCIGWARSLLTCSISDRRCSSCLPEPDAAQQVRQACGGIHLQQHTCRAFGPTAAAAQLEGSKAFLKVNSDVTCATLPCSACLAQIEHCCCNTCGRC